MSVIYNLTLRLQQSGDTTPTPSQSGQITRRHHCSSADFGELSTPTAYLPPDLLTPQASPHDLVRLLLLIRQKHHRQHSSTLYDYAKTCSPTTFALSPSLQGRNLTASELEKGKRGWKVVRPICSLSSTHTRLT